MVDSRRVGEIPILATAHEGRLAPPRAFPEWAEPRTRWSSLMEPSLDAFCEQTSENLSFPTNLSFSHLLQTSRKDGNLNSYDQTVFNGAPSRLPRVHERRPLSSIVLRLDGRAATNDDFR